MKTDNKSTKKEAEAFSLAEFLRMDEFEDGKFSAAELYLEKLKCEYGQEAEEIFKDAVRLCGCDQEAICHALFVLRRQDGWMKDFILEALGSKSFGVQDEAVACVECLGLKEALPGLKKLKSETSVGWFAKYIEKVIKELEG